MSALNRTWVHFAFVVIAHSSITGCNPAAPKNCILSGELFVTTKGGDVKKAAAVGIRLIPITPEFRQRIKELYAPINEENKKHMRKIAERETKKGDAKYGDAKYIDATHEYDEYLEHELLPHIEPLWAAGEQYLASVNAIETTTNSEGKFRIEAPEGSYLLVSGPFTILDDSVMWCKNLRISGRESSVSYNQADTIISRSASIMDKVASEVEK